LDALLKSNFPAGVENASFDKRAERRVGVSVGVDLMVKDSLGLGAKLGETGMQELAAVELQGHRIEAVGQSLGLLSQVGEVGVEVNQEILRDFLTLFRDDLEKHGEEVAEPGRGQMRELAREKLSELDKMELGDVLADLRMHDILQAAAFVNRSRLKAVLGEYSTEYQQRIISAMLALDRIVGEPPMQEKEPPNGIDTFVKLIERRPEAEVGEVVDFEALKKSHPSDASIKFLEYDLEFIHVQPWEDSRKYWRMHILNGIIERADPAEVEANLRRELQWAREALQPHVKEGKAAESKSFEYLDADGVTQDFYRLYPDGTVEKRQEYTSRTSGLFVPTGQVLFSTHWVTMNPDGELKYGQESKSMPEEKLK
jgi:hypothetical protein